MRKLFYILLLFLCSFNGLGNSINYEHRSLLKTLKKFGAEIMLKEFSFSEIKSNNLNQEGNFFTVYDNSASETVAYVYVGRVNSCRLGGCSAPGYEADISFEYFDYFILYNLSGAVEQVKVFNYQATHGQEITIKGWLRQFEDYNGRNQLKVGKQIDGIAGATISVHAITKDIANKTKLLNQVLRIQLSER